MSRQVRRMPKAFNWPLKEIWWGYQLDPIVCRICRGAGGNCWAECDNGKVYPQFDPPGLEGRGGSGTYYGWQMWETTSEGSPISPVFDTAEELARWLADTRAHTFADYAATYEQWLGMILGPGSAPSMVLDSNGLRSGVEALDSRAGTSEDAEGGKA